MNRRERERGKSSMELLLLCWHWLSLFQWQFCDWKAQKWLNIIINMNCKFSVVFRWRRKRERDQRRRCRRWPQRQQRETERDRGIGRVWTLFSSWIFLNRLMQMNRTWQTKYQLRQNDVWTKNKCWLLSFVVVVDFSSFVVFSLSLFVRSLQTSENNEIIYCD